MFILAHSLPPTITGDPVDKVRRDRVAMAGVLSLGAVNAAEARLAAEYVSTGFWAPHCQRMAFERESDFDVVRKCLMQAASRMREGNGGLVDVPYFRILGENSCSETVVRLAAVGLEDGGAALVRPFVRQECVDGRPSPTMTEGRGG